MLLAKSLVSVREMDCIPQHYFDEIPSMRVPSLSQKNGRCSEEHNFTKWSFNILNISPKRVNVVSRIFLVSIGEVSILWYITETPVRRWNISKMITEILISERKSGLSDYRILEFNLNTENFFTCLKKKSTN